MLVFEPRKYSYQCAGVCDSYKGWAKSFLYSHSSGPVFEAAKGWAKSLHYSLQWADV